MFVVILHRAVPHLVEGPLEAHRHAVDPEIDFDFHLVTLFARWKAELLLDVALQVRVLDTLGLADHDFPQAHGPRLVPVRPADRLKFFAHAAAFIMMSNRFWTRRF